MLKAAILAVFSRSENISDTTIAKTATRLDLNPQVKFQNPLILYNSSAVAFKTYINVLRKIFIYYILL